MAWYVPRQGLRPALRHDKKIAGVVKLVDAPDSKSGDGDIVWVRVPLSVPLKII